MADIIVINHISLDGVMQAPGKPEEDLNDGFEHGGWASAYGDAVMGTELGKSRGEPPGAFLFGRRTYEDLFASWHGRTDDNPFTGVLDRTTKYVASRTLGEPLPWENSVLLDGDAGDAVARLRSELGGHLMVFGSAELLRTLISRDLIDEYLLLIYPLLLGSGKRLFRSDVYTPLRLVNSVTTTTGVVIATYRPTPGQED